jgi:hypothetical protein
MDYLKEFADGVWIADGPIVRDMGAYFTTRMTVVKLSNGCVWISSPVRVPDPALSEIAEVGAVRYLVAATPRHVWRLEPWHALFPGAELWAARPTAFTLQGGRLPFSGFLGDSPIAAWRDDFDQLEFRGNFLLSEVLFFHKRTRTLLVDDLIQRNPELPGRTLTNWMFRLQGARFPDGGVPLDMRMTFFRRDLARRSLEKMLAWDFDKLIIAHGECIPSGAKRYVRDAFRWLQRS